MLRKIKLYGQLAEYVGHKEFEVKVANVSQAVSFLINNFPQLQQYMNPKYYQIKVGDYAINKEEIVYPIGKEDIHFIPVISGAGRGLGQILLGAVLIGFAFAGGAGFFGQAFAKNAGLFSFTKKIGFALVLGGVSQLLFPTPEPQRFESEEDPKLSFNFAGVQNTSRAGTPIPIVYGEIITGSVVISAAIDTNQIEG
jgi:predicted phage tail protein